jgi:hypothetical protein
MSAINATFQYSGKKKVTGKSIRNIIIDVKIIAINTIQCKTLSQTGLYLLQ